MQAPSLLLPHFCRSSFTPDRGWDSSLLPCPFSSLTFWDWWSCGPEALRFEKMLVLPNGSASDEWKDVYCMCIVYIYNCIIIYIYLKIHWKEWNPKRSNKTRTAFGGRYYYNANCLLPEKSHQKTPRHKQPWNQKFHPSKRVFGRGRIFAAINSCGSWKAGSAGFRFGGAFFFQAWLKKHLEATEIFLAKWWLFF